jgi:Lon protease-like protein
VPLLSLFPLDLVLFPGIPLPLHIFEPRYKEMIGECLAEKAPFGIVRAQESAVSEIGCTAEIVDVVKRYPDGRLDIVTAGRRRFELVQLNQERAFLRGEVLFFDDEPSASSAPQEGKARELHSEMLSLLGGAADVAARDETPLSFRLASSLPTDLDFKQTLLGMRSEADRIAFLVEYFEAVIPKLKQNATARKKASGNGHVR